MDLLEPRTLLKSIVGLWEAQIKLCKEAKKRDFGDMADKLWGFRTKSYEELYLKKDGRVQAGPRYKTRVAKSQEYVSVMTPHVYRRVPHRLATPSRPPVPEEIAAMMGDRLQYRAQVDARDKLQAWLATWFLNYTSKEFDLDREALTALPEALVKGRALLWCEMVDAPAGLIPASQFVSVDDLLIDADTKQWKDGGFIMRRRERSVWRVSEEFGIPRERLRAVSRSNLQEATDRGGSSDKEKKDICVYYEVFSRMGIGHRLADAPEEMKPLENALNALGPNIWLVIMPGVEHPLNLSPDALATGRTESEIKLDLQWPIAFYEEVHNPWPCTPLDFKPNADNPWSASELEPGLPFQIFLDHMYSWLMGKVRRSCRTLNVVSSSIQKEFMEALHSGSDDEIIEYNGEPGMELKALFETVKFPEINKDLYSVVSIMERNFEKATGLESLLYGAESERQMRSATEAEGREAMATSRPDEMKSAVDDWLSKAAAKEGQAARLLVQPQTIARLTGEPVVKPDDPNAAYGPLTEAFMAVFHTDDPEVAAAELSYSIEAGVGDRKNKQKQAADIQQLSQILLQPMLAFGSNTGNMGPYRGLMELLGESMDRPMGKLMLPDMKPPVEETPGAKK